jgi:Ca2+-transporting ATPase
MVAQNWHGIEAEEVLNRLESSHEGLIQEEAKTRLGTFGPNELTAKKRAGPIEILLSQFKDIFILMLLAAITISLFVGETTDAMTIGVIVVLNAVVGFVQEYRAERALEAMREMTAPKARVLRDGEIRTIPAVDIVPGDLLLLEEGDRIPADARLLDVIDLQMDEAVLTGESTPVEKSVSPVDLETAVADRKNMIFMATHVVLGRGQAVVTSTGMNTEFGKIAEIVQTTGVEDTPLKAKLNKFAKRLAVIIVAICMLIFIAEAFRGETLVGSFMIAIALAVSAVPEGLPAVLTVTLALGARDLAKRNAIMRRLASVETLGSTTVICSDKTGTLTRGEMTVRKIYTDGKEIEVTGVGYQPQGQFLLKNTPVEPLKEPSLELVLRIGALCNNAKLVLEPEPQIIGDPTEGSLIVTASKAGLTLKKLSQEYPRLQEIPFSSERKRMTTVNFTPKAQMIVCNKGAPETVLERCTFILKNGKKTTLTKEDRERILQANAQMASEALRVLGIAYKILPKNISEIHREELETGLIFAGLAGMIDPPREEAIRANRLCEEAGIKTIMITGDHRLTAVAVAKEIGMIDDNSIVLTGAELDRLNDEEFEEMVEGVRVYARVSPEHKQRIVKALQSREHIVAMTGDGVNDAPALKHADIGIAMGITGTDVTREAADMVLADDNFASIVSAIRGGRIIYDNIRKFAFFLMRCNFDEIFVIGTFALLNLPLPLLPAMILWLNLVTDGGPAIALSVDPPTEDVMRRPPRDPKEGVLHGKIASIVASFMFQVLGTALLFYIAYYVWGDPIEKARTMAFMQASFSELIVVWNSRSDRKNAFKVGFTSNKYLLASVIIGIALSISIVHVPILAAMFNLVPLTLSEWLIIFTVSSARLLLMPEYLYNRKIWKWV